MDQPRYPWSNTLTVETDGADCARRRRENVDGLAKRRDGNSMTLLSQCGNHHGHSIAARTRTIRDLRQTGRSILASGNLRLAARTVSDNLRWLTFCRDIENIGDRSVIFLGPRDFLVGRKTTTLLFTLSGGKTSARPVLTGKRLRKILGTLGWHAHEGKRKQRDRQNHHQ